MKARELRDLSTDELLDRDKEAREELFNLTFQRATGQLENIMRPRQVKREIARIRTVLRERKDEGKQ
jgi:large subunit ribosomal protein L29